MIESTEVKVPVSGIGIRHKARASVAVIGNPNAGKSTLFNRLTGLRQTTGNFPGVTVEKHLGTVQLARSAFNLVDLPGIYSLDGTSTDERIAVDVTLGRIPGTERPSGLLVVIDATHLYQGLYLLEQLLELQLPTMVALTMIDAATANGISIDINALQNALGGVPVYPVNSISGHGLDALKEGLEHITTVGDTSGVFRKAGASVGNGINCQAAFKIIRRRTARCSRGASTLSMGKAGHSRRAGTRAFVQQSWRPSGTLDKQTLARHPVVFWCTVTCFPGSFYLGHPNDGCH